MCYDDWCNIFRCDVVAGRKKPDYWDHALCRETDFDAINRQCHVSSFFKINDFFLTHSEMSNAGRNCEHIEMKIQLSFGYSSLMNIS